VSRSRRALLALGVALAAGGLVLALAPGLLAATGVDPSLAVPAVGALALALGLLAVAARLGSGGGGAETPEPERRRPHSTPGDGLDRQLATLPARGRMRGAAERAALDERLERAAVATLTRTEGWTEQETREQLQRGTWTEDRHAAAFFAPEVVPEESLSERARQSLRAESVLRRRATRAIAALADRLERD
jgi:hypothetical protein